MKKIIAILLVAVMMTLMLASCAQYETTIKFQLVRDDGADGIDEAKNRTWEQIYYEDAALKISGKEPTVLDIINKLLLDGTIEVVFDDSNTKVMSIDGKEAKVDESKTPIVTMYRWYVYKNGENQNTDDWSKIVLTEGDTLSIAYSIWTTNLDDL